MLHLNILRCMLETDYKILGCYQHLKRLSVDNKHGGLYVV